MTTTQILLIFSVTILTVVLAIIGVYVALVLKEVRENMKKIGPILDNVVEEQKYINDILKTAQVTVGQASTIVQYVNENVVEPIGGVVSLLKMLRGFVPTKSRKSSENRQKEEE